MANYIENTLEEGEEIIHKGRLHWSYKIRYTIYGVLIAIAGGVIACLYVSKEQDTDTLPVLYLGLALMLAGIMLIAWRYFVRSKSEFAITTTRFIQKDGILNIRMTEIPLFKIETVNFYQSLGERLVNTGSIELVGSGGTSHRVDFIQQPMKVRKILNASINSQKGEQA